MENINDRNTVALTHLSSLSQYFIPFGNFILPIIIWNSNKHKSEYINAQGKQVINFQLSLFLYSLVLFLIAFPILVVTVLKNIPFNDLIHENEVVLDHINIENITGMVILGLVAVFILFCIKVVEFFLIIYASVKTSNGEDFKYPITIPFIK